MDDKYIKLTQEWHRKGYESRQAEIDELKKRIDDVIKHIEPSDEISHKLYREVCTILKGINK